MEKECYEVFESYEMVTLNLLAFPRRQDYYVNAELATILFEAHEFEEGCSCELRSS